MFENKGL
jgi:hypothetical protein